MYTFIQSPHIPLGVGGTFKITMERKKKHIEGFNILFIFIVLGAMMAMLVGCVLVVKVPTKLPSKDTTINKVK